MARQVILRVLCDNTLPFRVWSKVHTNGSVFLLFLRTRPNFQKVANERDEQFKLVSV